MFNPLARFSAGTARTTLWTALALAFGLTLGGCQSVFGIRPPVPTILQGNIFKNADLDQLEEGMTESQVLYLLGTPLLRPSHASNEWHYYSSAVRDRVTNFRRLLVLEFEDSKLVSWEETLKNEGLAEAVKEARSTDPIYNEPAPEHIEEFHEKNVEGTDTPNSQPGSSNPY